MAGVETRQRVEVDERERVRLEDSLRGFLIDADAEVAGLMPPDGEDKIRRSRAA